MTEPAEPACLLHTLCPRVESSRCLSVYLCAGWVAGDSSDGVSVPADLGGCAPDLLRTHPPSDHRRLAPYLV